MANEYINRVFSEIKARDSHQPEFIQAVQEVLLTLRPVMERHPEMEEFAILERVTEPERAIQFRVPWVDDAGKIRVNRGFRVQFNNAIGPYKGGLRFHPSVNLGIIKFLGFEQIFKNALTTLPMGGGKGGSDFDPRGKSDGEVMRFCQSLMTELYRHISQDIDVPAGDIGVGAREIGYLYGMWKKITRLPTGVITGKGHNWGGSLIRPEATGYGVVWFTEQMLKERKDNLKDKVVSVSGSGNVSQYTMELLIEKGAKVVTASDSSGHIYDPEGIDRDKLDFILHLKNVRRGRIKEYADKYNVEFETERPWGRKVDIAIPCATQNEINIKNAKDLIANGTEVVCEGANLPCTQEAIDYFVENGIIFGPAKAANAGGVATSGLEMTQNSMRLYWDFEEVKNRLHSIMIEIHQTCKGYASEYLNEPENYVSGANIAGFMKVATSMIDQGVV